ncbi:copper amine oxidase N-terminal domain-containing protein [Paenibacillus alginolyticus]|uniref:copper amine oxidase N-terminal domain-containing protein n=1 Tax=Paenibacillus alginolyticus TaxID=59839 RepID=UPI00040CED78|nr:copper amine oxidase N-terminal domain-containing protein [Paenibacillus alginolyticus]MCY9665579.1 copper amine oxidase N-terminal domain-containing protein [Paenibacillus alginolyticus]
MKWKLNMVVSLAVVGTLLSSAAYAESKHDKGSAQSSTGTGTGTSTSTSTSTSSKDQVDVKLKEKKEKEEENEKDEEKDKGKKKKEKKDSGEHESVTSSTYGSHGHKGYKGLQNAYEHVQDRPAGAVISKLLEKYNLQLSDTTNIGSLLSDAVNEAENSGDLDTAADIQKEVVKSDSANLSVYKKLGALNSKKGKLGIKAYVNGLEPNFEVPPFIKDGNTLVPFRAIAEALQATVTWNPEDNSVTVVKDGVTVKLVIGVRKAFVNGQAVDLEVAGEVFNGSTMVPARFISEALKANVQWEPESQSVVINEVVGPTPDLGAALK